MTTHSTLAAGPSSNRPSLPPSTSASRAFEPCSGGPGFLLEGRAITKRFGQTEALRGVDLRIAAGEIVAIMGPSGSGKSTLLHCLGGILRPEAGEVWFDGGRIDDLSEAGRSSLRRGSFGFVFQFGLLVAELPAVENVALPLLLAGQPRRAAVQEAESWFERLGIGGLGSRRPGELSGGQAQRVALARAMVSRPRVVFADEPTGALDSLAGEQVMDLLTETARTDGVSVVLVTHEPRVAAYADREVIVRDGRVAADVAADIRLRA